MHTVLLNQDLVDMLMVVTNQFDLLFAESVSTAEANRERARICRFMWRQFGIRIPTSPTQHQLTTWRETIRRLVMSSDHFTDRLIQVDLSAGVINYTPSEEQVAH